MRSKFAIIMGFIVALAAPRTSAASPAATQNWVREYVKTNSPSANPPFQSKSFTAYDADGNENTIVIGLEAYDNPAMVVTGSSVPAIPSNTVFVKVGKNAYRNTSMGESADIVGSVENVGIEISDIVYEGRGTSRRVKSAVTNDVFEVVFRMTVGGVEWKSEAQDDGGELFREPNGIGFVSFAHCFVSDVVYEENTRVASSFFDSLLGIVFGSAYAVSPGTKFYTGKVEYDPPGPPADGEYKQKTYWKRKWYTDSGDVKTIMLKDITWINANGDEVVYSVYYNMLNITSGLSLQDVANDVAKRGSEDEVAAIDAAVKGSVNNVVWKMMTAGSGKDGYDKAVKDSINEVIAYENGLLAEYEAAVNPGNRLEGYGESGYDEVLKVMDHEHTWVGTCGSYVCSGKNCNEKTDGSLAGLPVDHEYESPGEGKCQRCRNEVPKSSHSVMVKCGDHSPFEADHAGFRSVGWDAKNCICQCGDIKLDHTFSGLDEDIVGFRPEYNSPNSCLMVWRCDRCGEVEVGNQSEGVVEMQSGFTVSRTSHAIPDTYAYKSKYVNGVSKCCLTNTCNHMTDYGKPGCGTYHEDVTDHEEDDKNHKVEEVSDDDAHHMAIVPCSHGFDGWVDDDGKELPNPRWCGWTTNKYDEAHDYLYERDGGRVGMVGDPIKPPTSEGHYRYDVCGRIVFGADGKATVTNDPYKGECGHVWEISISTHSGDEIYGNGSRASRAAGHDITNLCSACGYRSFKEREQHELGSDRYFYKDMVDHFVSNTCWKCGVDYYLKDEQHDPSFSRQRIFFGGTETYHQASNFCWKCQHDYYAGIEMHSAGRGDRWEVVKSAKPNFARNNFHHYTNECTGCKFRWAGKDEQCDKLGGTQYFITGDEEHHLMRTTCTLCGGKSDNQDPHVFVGQKDFAYLDEGHCGEHMKCKCEYVKPELDVNEHFYAPAEGDYDYMPKEDAQPHSCKYCRDPRTRSAHVWEDASTQCGGPAERCTVCGLTVITTEY